MTKPSAWCNCHLDTTPRHCRNCRPELKPTRKRGVGVRRVRAKKTAKTNNRASTEDT